MTLPSVSCIVSPGAEEAFDAGEDDGGADAAAAWDIDFTDEDFTDDDLTDDLGIW